MSIDRKTQPANTDTAMFDLPTPILLQFLWEAFYKVMLPCLLGIAAFFFVHK